MVHQAVKSLHALFAAMIFVACAAQAAERNVVLVTLDGVRWQEIFRGAEPALASDKRYQYRPESTQAEFVNVPNRTAALVPFLHDVIAKQGALIGNRDANSCAETANPFWFSYPGYNEILTGRADLVMHTNDKIDNPNVTILERLNKQSAFRNRVRAFGSWDVFPFIINRKRSGVPVNAAFEPFEPAKSERVKTLNELLRDVPSPWEAVRHDAFTFDFAMESLRQDQPRLLYIALGETDEFAHMGQYGEYLRAIRRSDDFLRRLWKTLQSDRRYAGNTTLIVTTDHGRGTGDKWRGHGSGRDERGVLVEPVEEVAEGSNQVWIAAIGPGIRAQPYTLQHCAHSDQIAATVLSALDVEWRDIQPTIGAPLFGANDAKAH